MTLPQLFKRSGYHTRGIGKLFHNWGQDRWKGDAKSWSVPEEMHYARHDSDLPTMDAAIPADTIEIPRAERREVPDEAYFDGRTSTCMKLP